MPANSNASITVTMTLVAGNLQVKSCITPSDPESGASVLCSQGV